MIFEKLRQRHSRVRCLYLTSAAHASSARHGHAINKTNWEILLSHFTENYFGKISVHGFF